MKKGFTLPEVMLVLSIIGVLMAIMIPILDNTKPDETTLKYRKTFFAIEQGVRNILNDVKLYESGDLRYASGTPTATETTIVIDDVTYINDTAGDDDGSGRRLCYNLANTLNTIGTVRCPGDGKANYTPLILGNGSPTVTQPVGADTAVAEAEKDENMTDVKEVNFTLSNGAAIGGITGRWNITNDDKSWAQRAFITLCVDVNGIARGPNRGCKTEDRADEKHERDQFRIRIARDGKVYTGSPTGPNNWYLETLMLVNPGGVIGDLRRRSAAERAELAKGINAAVSDLTTPESCPVGYEWYESAHRCIFLGGFSLEKLTGSCSSK